MKTDGLDCAAFRAFQIYVHEAVEGGLGDSKAGRTKDVFQENKNQFDSIIASLELD